MPRIGGLEKVSLLDYPEKISAIIFTYGCNLRCPYCHNPELVIHPLEKDMEVSKGELLEYLGSRKGLVDAVVITGGEPLIYGDIDSLVKEIKSLGFLVKLDTNGLYPEKLSRIIKKGHLDYIAMDIKCPLMDYNAFSGDMRASEKIEKSIELIMNSGVDYEFRTTYVKGIHDIEDGDSITKPIAGAKKYYIQNFRSGKTLDPKLDNSNSFTEQELKKILRLAKKNIKNSYIR